MSRHVKRSLQCLLFFKLGPWHCPGPVSSTIGKSGSCYPLQAHLPLLPQLCPTLSVASDTLPTPSPSVKQRFPGLTSNIVPGTFQCPPASQHHQAPEVRRSLRLTSCCQTLPAGEVESGVRDLPICPTATRLGLVSVKVCRALPRFLGRGCPLADAGSPG